MLDLIIYFALGVILIYYGIKLFDKNYSYLLISNNKFARLYSLVSSLLCGILSLATSFGTIYGESFSIYLNAKIYLFYMFLIYIIGMVLHLVYLKIGNNKFIFWNIKSVILIILGILMSLYLIVSLSVPSINYNYKEGIIEISDVFYHKEFTIDEIEGIYKDNTVPDINYNNNLFKVFNKYSLKGFFEDNDGIKYTILNNLKSNMIFSFAIDGKRIAIGFINGDDCEYFYSVVAGKLEDTIK